jgi:hypothetical protein
MVAFFVSWAKRPPLANFQVTNRQVARQGNGKPQTDSEAGTHQANPTDVLCVKGLGLKGDNPIRSLQ